MNEPTRGIADCSSNPNGWFVRDHYGRSVGFSSKGPLEAIEEAEGHGYFVRWGDRVVDEVYKDELRRRFAARSTKQ